MENSPNRLIMSLLCTLKLRAGALEVLQLKWHLVVKGFYCTDSNPSHRLATA